MFPFDDVIIIFNILFDIRYHGDDFNYIVTITKILVIFVTMLKELIYIQSKNTDKITPHLK